MILAVEDRPDLGRTPVTSVVRRFTLWVPPKIHIPRRASPDTFDLCPLVEIGHLQTSRQIRTAPHLCASILYSSPEWDRFDLDAS